MSFTEKVRSIYHDCKTANDMNNKLLFPEKDHLVEFPIQDDGYEKKQSLCNIEADTAQTGSLVLLVIETWRLKQAYDHLDDTLFSLKQRKRKQNQSIRFDKYFRKYLNDLGLDILDLTGKTYEEGLPVDPINLSDFNGETTLKIEIMMEPIIKILGTEKILKRGIVILEEDRE